LVGCLSSKLTEYADENGTEYYDHILPGPYTKKFAHVSKDSRAYFVDYRLNIYPGLYEKYEDEKKSRKPGDPLPQEPRPHWDAEEDDPLLSDLLIGQMKAAQKTAKESCGKEPKCCNEINVVTSYEHPGYNISWSNVLKSDKAIIYYQGFNATYDCDSESWIFNNKKHDKEKFKYEF
jgi:hypothetical protein